MDRKLMSFLLLLSSLLLTFCTSDKAPEPAENNRMDTSSQQRVCDTLKPAFQQAIKPIFMNNCAQSGCHGQGSARAGYRLESYSGIKRGVQDGRVLCAIKHEVTCDNMPQGGRQLSEEKIRLVECWSKNGAPDN